MRVAIYSRRSKHTDSGDSLFYQNQMCREHAARLFGECEFTIYEDEGFSGGNANRPMFRQLLRDIREGHTDVLLCYRLDRVSRSINDFTSILKLLEERGVGFVSVTERFDTTAPMGRAMLYIASVFAQLERDTTSQRIKDSFTELAKTGRRLTGKPPEGFLHKRLKDNDGRQYCVLEINNEEAEKLRLIYEMFLRLRNIPEVAAQCAIAGITGRNGYAVTPDRIRRILRHPVYAQADVGVYSYLAARYPGAIMPPGESFDGGGGVSVYRIGSGTPIIYPGTHEHIIRSKDWLETQYILDAKKATARPPTPDGRGVLRGLLFCTLCGSPMRPMSVRKNGWFCYVCVRKEKLGAAACPSANVSCRADKIVMQSVTEALASHKSTYIKNLPDPEKRRILSKVAEKVLWDGRLLEVIFFCSPPV